MSLESAIADLVSASTQLTQSVNVTRATVEATRDSTIAKEAPVTTAKDATAASATAATTDTATTASKLTTAAADYAAQKTTKGLAAVQTSADTELKDRLHRRDPARHPFRGARPSLVMDFVRRECHRNNAAGNLEQVDLSSFMTFTRASTATVVGPDGLIKEVASNVPRYGYDPVTGEALGLLVEEQRTNLINYSSQPNTWSSSNSIKYPNTALAPDDTLSALQFVENTTPGVQHLISASASSNPADDVSLVATVYVKPAGRTRVRINLRTKASNFPFADFNLTTGVVTNTGSYIGGTTTATITAVGGGWYRCAATSISQTGATAVAVLVELLNDAGSNVYTGDGASGIYIWGAQLEAGAFPTSYIPTPATFTGRASTKTYFDSNGVLQTAASGVAVTDYGYVDGRWVSKGLSLEPQATNLLIQSQDFSGWGTNWVTPPTISRNTAISPSGIASCVDITFTTDSDENAGLFIFGPSIPANTVYTASVFLKKSVGSTLRIRIEGDVCFGGTSDIYFDQTTGNILQQQNIGAPFSVNVVNYGAWYRICVTRTTIAAGNVNVCFYSGVVGTNRFVIYGAQLETGPVATSYIPTTTAQVTRAADTSTSAQVTRASDVTTVSYAASPIGVGTVSVVHDRISNPIGYILEVNTGGVDNSRLVCRSHGSTSFRVFNIRTLLTTPSQDTDVTNIAARSAFALSYSGVGCKTSRGGGVVKSLPSIESAHASVFNTIRIGWTSGNISNGYIRQLTYFPRQLSDADLQALTILED